MSIRSRILQLEKQAGERGVGFDAMTDTQILAGLQNMSEV